MQSRNLSDVFHSGVKSSEKIKVLDRDVATQDSSGLTFGTGYAPSVLNEAKLSQSVKVLSADANTADPSGLKFGAGSAPAVLVQSSNKR